MDQEEPISMNQDLSKVIVKHVVLAYSVTKSDSRPWGHVLTISLGLSRRHASILLRDSFHFKGSMSSQLSETLVIDLLKQNYDIAVSKKYHSRQLLSPFNDTQSKYGTSLATSQADWISLS